ncbi:MAG: AbrB family transcriptional regulator [Geminocystis sp.]|nr:AbrB family transcriptional regulator [Geminocystis sp.]HIK37468.1 AbrB family transcriptional regulator [Geminocystis sp. M7585_C2015_104]MCS7147413.1 AbrB family transcriptional regulator [Geminocystis sp.]MCX8079351.1 AbrB family transcriptional regulator [Geminocystis sp.]MDW8117102.1 AbrB family transcriptional regulator [Geminocystis sp.]
MSDKKPQPLTGKELLKKVKKLGNMPREEKAIECGYYTITKKGHKRVNMVKFLNALMEAEGITLDNNQPVTQKKRGRTANYRINVQSNGNLSIGRAYTEKMGLKPGDEFEVILGRKNIYLRQIEA